MEDRAAILREVGFCAALPEAVIRALATIATPERHSAGVLVQLEGDPAEAMYVVARGRVKITRIGSNGREQVLNVIGPGGHFNTVPMFDGGDSPANAEALDDVMLLALPRDALLDVVAQYPPLALALLKEFTGRLRHFVELVDEIALHSVQGRLAGLLLKQASAAARGEAAPVLTQAEMAARIGTVREMIGRALKGFEVQGLIRLDRGQITILDRPGLEAQHEEGG